MIKVLKYDYFYVTLKITPLLASKVSLFYDKFIDATYVDPVCFIFTGFIHVENEGYSKMI